MCSPIFSKPLLFRLAVSVSKEMTTFCSKRSLAVGSAWGHFDMFEICFRNFAVHISHSSALFLHTNSYQLLQLHSLLTCSALFFDVGLGLAEKKGGEVVVQEDNGSQGGDRRDCHGIRQTFVKILCFSTQPNWTFPSCHKCEQFMEQGAHLLFH